METRTKILIVLILITVTLITIYSLDKPEIVTIGETGKQYLEGVIKE